MKTLLKWTSFAGLVSLLLAGNVLAQSNALEPRLPIEVNSKTIKEASTEIKAPVYVDRAAQSYDSYRYQKPANDSRYDTSQGWSRSRNYGYGHWWGGYHGQRSDIPTSGYTPPATKR